MVEGWCISEGCDAEIREMEVRENELDRYVCEKGHKNLRRIYHEEVSTTKINGEIAHKTAAVILYQDSKIYLQKRNRAPEGYTIPAGHIDEIDGSAEEAAARELAEETNVKRKPDELEKIFEKTLKGDKCTKGANIHLWKIFSTEISEGDKISLNNESSNYIFREIEEFSSVKMTPATRKLWKTDILSSVLDH